MHSLCSTLFIAGPLSVYSGTEQKYKNTDFFNTWGPGPLSVYSGTEQKEKNTVLFLYLDHSLFIPVQVLTIKIFLEHKPTR